MASDIPVSTGHDLYKYLKNKGYSDALLKESGLMQVDEKHGMYDKFWNRVMFPIMDSRGNELSDSAGVSWGMENLNI